MEVLTINEATFLIIGLGAGICISFFIMGMVETLRPRKPSPQPYEDEPETTYETTITTLTGRIKL